MVLPSFLYVLRTTSAWIQTLYQMIGLSIIRISRPNVLIETTVLRNELDPDQPAVESTIAQLLNFKIHDWTVRFGDRTCALPATQN